MRSRISKKELISSIGNIYKDKLIDNSYEVIDVHPLELISDKRIDILIKLISSDFFIGLNHDKWAESIYEDHIRCITEGTFKENGSLTKHSLSAFKTEFKTILKSIENNGFDSDLSVVPVTKDMVPINGAHRVAACLKYNVRLKVCVIPEINVSYTPNFFKKRGLSNEAINAALIKLLELNSNYVCGVVWPASNVKNEDVENFLPNAIEIKKVMVNKAGMHNLICEAYSNEVWLGTPDTKYVGAWKKALPCFGTSTHREVNFFMIKVDNGIDLVSYKDEIRKKFNIGKHSIHICDDNIDSSRLLKYFTNTNLSKILNMSSPYTFPLFITNLEKLRSELYDKDLTENDIILDGSSLLGILGLRKPNDIDYLATEDLKLQNADFHLSEMKYHDSSLSELMTNPDKYIWIFGFRFLSINELIKMKSNRNENKDQVDISLLKAFSRGGLIIKLKAKYLGVIHFTKIKIRAFLVHIINMLRLKAIIKRLIKFIS
jgi:hypothetical protein